MRRSLRLANALLVLTAALRPAVAQAPAAPTQSADVGAALDELLSPIALYPDPLLALMLTAAGQPVQIVLASRYVTGGGDPSLIAQQPWISSVQSLAAYPDALKTMDDNLAWTQAVGDAFLSDPQGIMNAIQDLRAGAISVGTLQSTPQQQVVTDDDGTIEIVPADPGDIYVPDYSPESAYSQQTSLSFDGGAPIQPSLDQDMDWSGHQVIVWSGDHPRPPDWWRRPELRRDPSAAPHEVWSPQPTASRTVAGRIDRGYQPSPNQAAAAQPRFGAPRPDSSAVNRAGPSVRPSQPTAGFKPVQAVANARPSQPIVETKPVQAIEEPTGALIGVESARTTQQYSSRGAASSRAAAPSPPQPPAPASRPAPTPVQPGRHK